MPSSITANLTGFGSSYLNLWKLSNFVPTGVDTINGVTSGYTANTSTNVVTQTTGSIPLVTGDVVYLATTVSGSFTATRYMIRLSDNTFSLATSRNNALNSIPTTLAYFTSGGNPSFSGVAISNVPMVGSWYGPVSTNTITEALISSSKSAQSFAVTDSATIDFTVPSIKTFQQYEIHNHYFWTCGLTSDTGSYTVGFFDDGSTFRCGDINTSISTGSKTNATTVFRITLQNRQISIANRRINSTYTTLFTSSTLSLNIQGLRFFANLTLNGQAFTNCTITYL